MKESETQGEKISNFLQFYWDIKPQEINFIEEGDSTNNWKVTSENGETYVFRNAGGYRDYVRFQCDVLMYLAESNFPYQAPLPIETKQGTLIVDTPRGSFILYEYIPGHVLKKIIPSDAVEIGRMLATYHEYVSGFDWKNYEQLRSKDLFEQEKIVDFIIRCETEVTRKRVKTETDQLYLSRIKGFRNFYLGIIAHTKLDLYNLLARIPCHGDFERRNIIKREGNIVGFIDLGGITIDPQVCDLQNCIQLNSMGNGQLDLRIAESIVGGYISHIGLEKGELEFVLPLVYSEMLKTLSWVMAERTNTDARVDESEATERIKILSWIIENYQCLRDLFEGTNFMNTLR